MQAAEHAAEQKAAQKAEQAAAQKAEQAAAQKAEGAAAHAAEQEAAKKAEGGIGSKLGGAASALAGGLGGGGGAGGGPGGMLGGMLGGAGATGMAGIPGANPSDPGYGAAPTSPIKINIQVFGQKGVASNGNGPETLGAPGGANLSTGTGVGSKLAGLANNPIAQALEHKAEAAVDQKAEAAVAKAGEKAALGAAEKALTGGSKYTEKDSIIFSNDPVDLATLGFFIVSIAILLML